MGKQKRHLRRSKRGRRFVAGKRKMARTYSAAEAKIINKFLDKKYGRGFYDPKSDFFYYEYPTEEK